MKSKINEIEVNGVKYVEKGAEHKPAKQLDGMEYCLVRSRDAGVFAGYVDRNNSSGGQAVVHHARRIWFWSGASTLSQLAVDGTKNPDSCKFPCEVDEMEVMGICEIIPCTEKARNSIQAVKVWQQ